MLSIEYGKTTIYYSHYKQTRNDVKITVNLINGVKVHTPENINEAKLSQIMKQKAP